MRDGSALLSNPVGEGYDKKQSISGSRSKSSSPASQSPCSSRSSSSSLSQGVCCDRRRLDQNFATSLRATENPELIIRNNDDHHIHMGQFLEDRKKVQIMSKKIIFQSHCDQTVWFFTGLNSAVEYQNWSISGMAIWLLWWRTLVWQEFAHIDNNSDSKHAQQIWVCRVGGRIVNVVFSPWSTNTH